MDFLFSSTEESSVVDFLIQSIRTRKKCTKEFIMRFILYLVSSLFLLGCASTATLPTPNWVPWEMTTRASLPFESNGQKYNGAGVLQRSPSIKITFTLPKDTAKLMINSCNREEFFGYPENKPFNWIYIPLPYLESDDSCLVMATAITKQGELYRSIIDFVSVEAIPATLRCNGQSTQAIGVGLCQTRAGLIQAIEFKEEVVGVEQDGCPKLEPYPTIFGFQFKTLPGFCAYRFMNQRREVFRLTTYGYESIDEVKIQGKDPSTNSGTNPINSGWGG